MRRTSAPVRARRALHRQSRRDTQRHHIPVPHAIQQLADGDFRQPQTERIPHRRLVGGASAQPEQFTRRELRQRQFADKPFAVVINDLVTRMACGDVVLLKLDLTGMTVNATATLKEVDGRRLVFTVSASDEAELIGEGTHERFIVDRERFEQRARNKQAR